MQQDSIQQLPSISCKCITYGRVSFLEEALHSFLKQEYPGPKELIIVNDYPLQTLVFDHPEVKIYNLDKTFDTIGEKENFALSKCSGELIAVWDDDDIALPNHLDNIYKYFSPGANLLHWNKGVYFNEGNVTSLTAMGNSGIVYTKKVWESIGGHPLENAGYDATFTHRIHALGSTIFASPSDEDVSWFYMWGGRGYHMSGQGTDIPGNSQNVIKRHSNHIEKLRMNGKIPTGTVQLKPNWKLDYSSKLKEFIDRKSSTR